MCLSLLKVADPCSRVMMMNYRKKASYLQQVLKESWDHNEVGTQKGV